MSSTMSKSHLPLNSAIFQKYDQLLVGGHPIYNFEGFQFSLYYQQRLFLKNMSKQILFA